MLRQVNFSQGMTAHPMPQDKVKILLTAVSVSPYETQRPEPYIVLGIPRRIECVLNRKN